MGIRRIANGLDLPARMCVYTIICIHAYTCIYIYRKREKVKVEKRGLERDKRICTGMVLISLCVHTDLLLA